MKIYSTYNLCKMQSLYLAVCVPIMNHVIPSTILNGSNSTFSTADSDMWNDDEKDGLGAEYYMHILTCSMLQKNILVPSKEHGMLNCSDDIFPCPTTFTGTTEHPYVTPHVKLTFTCSSVVLYLHRGSMPYSIVTM